MKKVFFLLFFNVSLFFSQTISEKLAQETQLLLSSPEMLSGSLSFYVSDDSGKLIYENQGNKGFSTASTQKIFTAACVLDLLGKDFQFSTKIAYSGPIAQGYLKGNLCVTSNGDPTLGSWRYDKYKPEDFLQKLLTAIKSKNISKIKGDLVIDDTYFDFQKIPGGWPFNDMGNYYGAGVWGINWRENQFDIDAFGNEIKNIHLDFDDLKTVNELKTAGEKDKSLIYTAPFSKVMHINGSLPAKQMKIAGANPNPPHQLGLEILKMFREYHIAFSGKILTNSERLISGEKPIEFPKNNLILSYKSPTLDKITYYFLRKSVNLYGETLIKTLGKEKTGNPTFESGLQVLKDFWIAKGIPEKMINFCDGSGLSPQNYVSAKAEVLALLWAKKQPWFSVYLDAFPTYNAMKMKSGTIKNTKAFAGYQSSKDGKNYVFSIIINNYQGNNESEALYKILNVLK